MGRAWAWVLLLIPALAEACPFCDQGGVDAAKFILAVFGSFSFAVLFVLFAVRRGAKNRPSKDPNRTLFEAENKEIV